MHRIAIKPLSVNQCWKGQRFKTDAYRSYARSCGLLMPPDKIPEGLLSLILVFGVSNMAADVDNPAKPFIDVLQAKYQFDDKRIVHLVLEKTKVTKGQEFVMWEFRSALPTATKSLDPLTTKEN